MEEKAFSRSVGIITFHRTENYGALLQAYALQKCINKLGIDAEIIDYRSNIEKNHLKSMKSRAIHYMWEYIARPLLGGNIRKKGTDEFRKSYLKISNRIYKDLNELNCYLNNYNALIVGSDQVWNPKIVGEDRAFFLDFGRIEIPRIAYAPSFGTTYIDEEKKPFYRDCLSRIDYISAREKAGAQIVKEIMNKEIDIVLDPTLLLSAQQWKEGLKLKDKNERSKYILCYHMPGNDLVNNKIDEIAETICKKTGTKPLHIGEKEYRRYFPKRNSQICKNSKEFLEFVMNAQHVVTNSYHGTIFSIIFKVPFTTVMDKGQDLFLNSRILDLLGELNLGDCLCYTDQHPKDVNHRDAFIAAEEILIRKVEYSQNYICNALKGI